MRVLFINTVFEKGSTGRIVKDLGTAIEEKGGEYRAIYGRGTSNDSHAIKFSSNFGVIIHALCARIFDRAGFYSSYSTRRMIEYIREYNPDIIHLHNLHGYYVNIEILFKYLKSEYKGRVVWTLHDCWAYTGHCTHYTAVGCNKWKNCCEKCVQKKEYPASIFKDNSYNNYKRKKSLFTSLDNITIIVVSDWLAGQVKQSFFKKYSIVRIYNGIDHNIFKHFETNIKEKLGIASKTMILCVSDGWNERKGYNDIIKWANIVNEEVRFVIVGLNKKQIKKLPNNIIGLKRTQNIEQLVQLYSAADWFFNPSKEETFGMVTAEAMACGTPILAYNATACAELIDDNSGQVLNDFSEILTFKLENQVYDGNTIIQSSMRFDKDNIMQQTYDLYKDCLNDD